MSVSDPAPAGAGASLTRSMRLEHRETAARARRCRGGSMIDPIRRSPAHQVAAERVDRCCRAPCRASTRARRRAPAGTAAPTLDQLVDEVLHERRLAHAGAAVDAHRHQLAAARAASNASRRRAQLRLAPDEGARAAAGPAGARSASGGRLAGEPPLAHAAAISGVPWATARGSRRSSARHRVSRSVGDAGHALARRRGVDQALARQHLARRAGEGRASDERLVEHGADAVPVARGRGRLLGGLLGRHVARGADDLALAGASCDGRARGRSRPRSRGAPRAPRRVDEHVRRLDVAMQLARRVQGAHAPRRAAAARAGGGRSRRATARWAARGRGGRRASKGPVRSASARAAAAVRRRAGRRLAGRETGRRETPRGT